MENRPLRLGFVGAGQNTRDRHLPGFRALPDVAFVAVCNRRVESARAVAEAWGIGRVEADWRVLVEADDIDAVCIGTWPDSHAEVALAALAARKHVLCEARMAADLHAARAMAAAAAAARNHGQVFQLVPAPFTLEVDAHVRALLADGALGALRSVEITHRTAAFLDPRTPVTFRHRQDRSGINLLSLGICLESVQRWLPQEQVAVVSAQGCIFVAERPDPETGAAVTVDLPDVLQVLGRWESGALLNIRLSSVEPGRPIGTLRLVGERGVLHLDFLQNVLKYGAEGRPLEVIEVPEGRRRGWRVEADFVASIREGLPVTLTDAASGLRYMAVTDACFRSWQAGGALQRVEPVDA